MGSCDETWKAFQQLYYKMGDDDATWDEANTYCSDQGGTLASLNKSYYYQGAIDFLSM